MFYREYTLAGDFTAKAGDVVFEARKLEDDGGKAEIVVKGKVLYNSIDECWDVMWVHVAYVPSWKQARAVLRKLEARSPSVDPVEFVRVKAAYTNAKAEGKPLPACEPEESIYNDPLFQEFLKHQPPSW